MSTAVYVRVSSEDQAERGTIENQIEFASKYCDLHQLGDIEFYKDDGVTGTISLEEREAGKRLMDDARAGNFNLLLIYKLDRLGRSARIILNAVYELEKLGIKIKSMTEPFDTGDPSGRFLLTILAGVADLERETILDRLTSGANRAARMGKWLGGIVPYGYFKNKEGYLEISTDLLPGFDLSEKDVIKLIYRLITEEKMSTIKIADYLNALGIPPSYTKDNRKVLKGKRKENTSGMWQPSRVGNTAKNTIYKGIHGYGKRTTKDREIIYRPMPAIVSEDVWEQAQVILRSNKIMSRKNSKHKYLLRGLIKCADCNLTYIGTYYHSSKGTFKGYYVCNGKQSYRGKYQGKCKSINVSQEWIENLVWTDLENYISDPSLLLIEPSQPINYESEKKSILRTIEQKEAEKQSILDLYRKKIISIQDVEIQIDKMANEILSLQNRIKEIDGVIKNKSSLKTQHNTAIELLTSLQGRIKNITWEEKREIVELLVKKITVDREKENPKNVDLSIEYNFLSC